MNSVLITKIAFVHLEDHIIPIGYGVGGKMLSFLQVYKAAFSGISYELITLGERYRIPILNRDLLTGISKEQCREVSLTEQTADYFKKISLKKLNFPTLSAEEFDQFFNTLGSHQEKDLSDVLSEPTPPEKSKNAITSNEVGDLADVYAKFKLGIYVEYIPPTRINDVIMLPRVGAFTEDQLNKLIEHYVNNELLPRDDNVLKDLKEVLYIKDNMNYDIGSVFRAFGGTLQTDLYNLLRVDILKESKLGLYGGLSPLLFKYKLSLEVQGLDDFEVNSRINYMLLQLACNKQELDIISEYDIQGDVEDKESLMDEVDSDFYFDDIQVAIFDSYNTITNVIREAIKNNQIHFSPELKDKNLSLSEKFCISATYNYPTFIKTPMQTKLKLDVLNFRLKEYDLEILFCGNRILPFALGNLYLKYQNYSKSDTFENQEKLKTLDYNDQLSMTQRQGALNRKVGAGYYHTIMYIKDCQFTLNGILICRKDGKIIVPGIVLLCKNTVKGLCNYTIFPFLSTNYKELEAFNIPIKVKDDKIILKSQKTSYINGKPFYTLEPTFRAIKESCKKQGINLARSFGETVTLTDETLDIFKSLEGMTEYYRKGKRIITKHDPTIGVSITPIFADLQSDIREGLDSLWSIS